MWTHFYAPNTQQIEKGLLLLEDRLAEEKKKRKTQGAHGPYWASLSEARAVLV
jgi:hypothetical protein